MIPPWGTRLSTRSTPRFRRRSTGYQPSVQTSSPRATLAALALSAGLGLGVVACSKAEDSPTSPATNVSPESSTRTSDANTVPPGVSGEGARGDTGQGGSNP